jgi:UDPglucose--hexose-1-phosphate uridylyltransferase
MMFTRQRAATDHSGDVSPARHIDGRRAVLFSGAAVCTYDVPGVGVMVSQQPVEQVELVLRTIHQRYQDLMRDRRFQSIIIFKNHGAGAGTTLRHPHWQIISPPVMPQLSRQRYLAATEFFDCTGERLDCVMVAEELSAAK